MKHSPDVTSLGFACTHMLSALFRHGNLATFYTPPSLCSSNLWGPLWPFLPCYLPKTLAGLKFTQCSKITGGRCSFFHITEWKSPLGAGLGRRDGWEIEMLEIGALFLAEQFQAGILL